MATFNGETLVITLDSGQTEVDLFNDIYEPWKDWMLASPLNRGYPAAFRSDGGNPLSSIINQGSYIFLNNSAGWRIKPPEEDITIYLTGNLAVEDTTLPAFIPTTGDFTAAILGLQPVTQGVTEDMASQLRYNAFQGGVSIDITSGIDISYTNAGTVQYPVNNLADAFTIAQREGLRKFFINKSMTLTGVHDFSDGYKFIGASPVTVIVSVDTSLDVTNCEFWDMQISGTLDGGNVFRECIVGSVEYVNGFLYNCALVGPIILGGGAPASIAKCWVFTGQQLTVDMGGSGNQMAVSEFSGAMKIENCTGGTGVTEINYLGGEMEIDATVSAGTFHIHGTALVIDNSTGTATVDDKTTTKRVDETWRDRGFDKDNPATITDTQKSAGGVVVSITDTGTSHVLQRQ